MTSLPRIPAHRRGPPAPLPISRENEHSIIRIVGDQDLTTVPILETALMKALVLDNSHLVIDLRETSFIDAATIGALIGSRTAFELQSRNLTLRAPSDFVRRVLGLCGLDHLIDPNPAPTWTPTRPENRHPPTTSAEKVTRHSHGRNDEPRQR